MFTSFLSQARNAEFVLLWDGRHSNHALTVIDRELTRRSTARLSTSLGHGILVSVCSRSGYP